MASLYLNGLTKDQRAELEKSLWQQQGGRCFISDKAIELGLSEVDIDHIIPIRDNGPDKPENFALTLSSYNRSKQASDLRVARVLARLEAVAETASDGRGANLGDVLRRAVGEPKKLRVKIEGDTLAYLVEGSSQTDPVRVKVHVDKLSAMRFFFAVLPIETLHHDSRINPRPIGASIRGLIEEFHKGRPQLHVALGWISSKELPEATVNIFDGQHKAAAQVLLGATEIPVRIFLDPDIETLLTANTNAGTKLRQVAFDKSIQRHLGSSILYDRIVRYRAEKGFPEDYDEFSERTLVDHFRGEQRAMQRYVLDAVRDAVTHSPENKLSAFIEAAGKGYEKPFSYSAIEKTFYSQFIYSKMLETPWSYQMELGTNPRELEKSQLIRLMSLIAERLYIGHYNPELGTRRIENQIQMGEDVPEPHLRAFRMAKEEVLQCWIGYIGRIVENYFTNNGKIPDKEKLFQYQFPDQLWVNIENFIVNLGRLPLWVNKAASVTVFGGKQNYQFWQSIFEKGVSTGGHQVLSGGINITDMIKTP